MRALTGNQISPNPGMEYGSTGMSYLFIDATGSGVMLRQSSRNSVLFLEDFQFVYLKKNFLKSIFSNDQHQK